MMIDWPSAGCQIYELRAFARCYVQLGGTIHVLSRCYVVDDAQKVENAMKPADLHAYQPGN